MSQYYDVAWTPALYTDASFSSKVPGAFTMLENFRGEWVASVLTWDADYVAHTAEARNLEAGDGPFVARRGRIRKEGKP